MKMTRPFLGAAFAVLSLHPLLGGQAAPEFVLVVETGQSAPAPTSPATFAEVSNPVTNARGDVVFRARLTGTGITTANNEALYRRDAAGTITRIIGEGEIVPDVNLPLLFVGAQHNLLDDGTVVFLAIFGAGATLATDGVLLQATPGQPVKTLLREGQPIGATGFNVGPNAIEPGTGVPPQPLYAFGDLNGNGTPDLIAFGDPGRVVPSGGGVEQTALLYLIDGVVQLGVKEGDPVPGLEGQVFSDAGFGFSIGGLSLNTGITFLGSGANFQQLGIFQQPLSGSVKSVVLRGGKAKGFGKGFTFTNFNDPSSGSDGHVIFSATASKAPNASGNGNIDPFRTGLFHFQDGKLTFVAGRDRAAAGIPGPVVYSGFDQPVKVGQPRAGLYVDLFNPSKPGDPLREALYVRDGGLKLLAYETGPAPDVPGATIQEHDSLTSDDFVNLFWIALLLDDEGAFEAIYETFLDGKKPDTNILLRVPGIVDFGTNGPRTVIDVLSFNTVPRGSGAPRLATTAGLVLSCNFKDGTNGVVFCPQQEAPIYQPDIIVQSGPMFRGDDIYETKPSAPQMLPIAQKAPIAMDLLLILQNDALLPDTFKFKAKSPVFVGDDRAVLFFENNVDISGDVFGKNGITTQQLPPSASTTVTIRIVVPAGTTQFDIPKDNKKSSRVKIKLSLESQGNPEREDVFEVTVNLLK